MRPWCSLFVPFLVFPPALALSLPPSSSLSLNANITDILPNTTLSNTTNPTEVIGRPQPLCDPAYGREINPNSCANAWKKIERSTTKRVFRTREGILTEDEPLPVRYLSDDGRCAIDIDSLDKSYAEETSDGLTISEHAGAVLVKCVYGSKTGGFIPIEDSPPLKFDVAIQQYEPNITCYGGSSSRAPNQGSCDSALSLMPADRARVFFGRSRATGGARLPQQFYPPLWNPQKCQVQVDMPLASDPTTASWYDIWAAGVAINTLCVQRGMSGTAVNLGAVNDITVTLAK